MNHSHDCECGPHDGPMTPQQHQRIHFGRTLCETWLKDAASGDANLQALSVVAVRTFIGGAPTFHDRIVRLTGLVDYLARRCAAQLPTKFDEFGKWVIQNGPFAGPTIDDTTPEARVAIRLMIAYVNRDEVFARDLILGFVNGLPDDVLPEQLADVFFCLTELYLWMRRNRAEASWRQRTANHDL